MKNLFEKIVRLSLARTNERYHQLRPRQATGIKRISVAEWTRPIDYKLCDLGGFYYEKSFGIINE